MVSQNDYAASCHNSNTTRHFMLIKCERLLFLHSVFHTGTTQRNFTMNNLDTKIELI